jgi:hypothetical protein
MDSEWKIKDKILFEDIRGKILFDSMLVVIVFKSFQCILQLYSRIVVHLLLCPQLHVQSQV